MHDLTQGSIPRHITLLAAPIAAGMVFQTLYYLVDLYFVAQLGDSAVAGVGAAGSLHFIVFAVTQVLGVGTMALISHAAGRKDAHDANLIFNQSLLMSAICATATLVLGYALSARYMHTLGADAETISLGTTYLYWYMPGLALQFAINSMGAALRGTGIAKPTMIVQMLTVLLNVFLAPVLIAGWLTGHALGVAGAGLATSISVAVGTVLMLVYFLRLEHYVKFESGMWSPRMEIWRRILKIGLPPGGEFALMFAYMAVIYWVIRDFGAEAQAGFGIGMRVMQAIFLPAMAIAFATAPVAGQNMGAGLAPRVRETFRSSIVMCCSMMLMLTLLCQWRPDVLIRVFTHDTAVIAVGAQFLHIVSWNFAASGVIFTCSGMFQALGNTLPGLLSSATRLLTFAVPAVWLSRSPGFTLRDLWLLSFSTVVLQALVSLLFMKVEFRERLPAPA